MNVVTCRKSGDNLQLILLRESSLAPPPAPPTSVRPSSPYRGGTSTLPRSHRFPSSSPSPSHNYTSTLSHTPSTSPAHHPSPLSSSIPYGALSQDNLPLMAARSSHHYSSLSHLPPRSRVASSPHSYGGSSSILSQPAGLAGFDMEPQVIGTSFCLRLFVVVYKLVTVVFA